jgi:HEAT repeat protein
VLALALVNPPDLAECLQPLLKDKNDSVREAASSALKDLAEPAASQTPDH